LPEDLAPGRYRLEVGLYSPGDGEVGLPSLEGHDSVVLDYLPVEGMTTAAPETQMEADFDGVIELIGYTLACDPQLTGCTLQLAWQGMTDLDIDYTVFAHLVGQDGTIAGQHDGMPEGGQYPTSAWEPGEIVIDEHSFDIAADPAPGDYRLLVGLYRLETGERLQVLGPDGQPLGDHVVLTEIPIGKGQ
jgi:hypothetical protein